MKICLRLALIIFLGGCTIGTSDSNQLMKDQHLPSRKGFISVDEANRSEFLDAMSSVAKDFGLSHVDNVEVKNLIVRYENRDVYDAFFCKNDICGLVLSDVSARNRFGYQIYSEPFSHDDFDKFESAIIRVLRNYDISES